MHIHSFHINMINAYFSGSTIGLKYHCLLYSVWVRLNIVLSCQNRAYVLILALYLTWCHIPAAGFLSHDNKREVQYNKTCYYHLLTLPPAMASGSISMTMKASGIGSVHWYSVFDGKLVNRGCLFLRLTVAGTLMCFKATLTICFQCCTVFCCLTTLTRLLVVVVFFVDSSCLHANVCPEHSLLLNEGQLALVFSQKTTKVLFYKNK